MQNLPPKQASAGIESEFRSGRNRGHPRNKSRALTAKVKKQWVSTFFAFFRKIAQFPKGTQFRIATGYPGTWWANQRRAELIRIIETAGGQVTASPDSAR
jgi:hypothetical protein